MKNIFYVYILFALVISSCTKEEIDTFSGEAQLYFTDVANKGIDSTSVTFAYELPSETMDSLVGVPVSIQGFVADIDRKYAVEVGEESTLIEGTHFDFEDDFLIEAGQVRDTLYLRLYRTEEMLSSELFVDLRLKENENFGIDVYADLFSNSLDRNLYVDKFSISVSDILTQPTYWPELFFGTFSKKKLYLYAEVNNIPVPNWTTTSEPLSAIYSKGQKLRDYLRDMKNAGTPVLDEDGEPMTLGRYLPF